MDLQYAFNNVRGQYCQQAADHKKSSSLNIFWIGEWIWCSYIWCKDLDQKLVITKNKNDDVYVQWQV